MKDIRNITPGRREWSTECASSTQPEWRGKLLSRRLALLGCAVLSLIWANGPARAQYLAMDPPPDVDKAGVPSDNSCWLATAANMLAGAGYGNGGTVQARADNIYGQLTAHFGIADGGWIDTALTWWLNSANNVWQTTNPYKQVSVYGNKTKVPFGDGFVPFQIGDFLRADARVGLSISWPQSGSSTGTGGHAITDWGDENSMRTPLTANPAQVMITDSDDFSATDIQTYSYDAFTNPNPGGPNHGHGWYINYGGNHPFIKHYTILSAVDDPAHALHPTMAQGSKRITNNRSVAATDLHYDVYAGDPSGYRILSYWTSIDWNTTNQPQITEEYNAGGERIRIHVDWDLSDNPVPPGTTVAITTEFVYSHWNVMTYENVRFSYPDNGLFFWPGLRWQVLTATNVHPWFTNVSGGYVVGSIRYSNPQGAITNEVEERFQHQYNYLDSPESHQVNFQSATDQVAVTQLAFGHSYGSLPPDQLWSFTNWLTRPTLTNEVMVGPGSPLTVDLDWSGRLPYPAGDGPFPAPVRLSINRVGTNSIRLDWGKFGGVTGYGTNKSYRVEFRDSLSGAWAPLPPTNQWPTTRTTVIDPATKPMRTYRVRVMP